VRSRRKFSAELLLALLLLQSTQRAFHEKQTNFPDVGGSAALTQVTPGKAAANDRIRVCVIGVNGRGKDHIKGFQSLVDAEVAMLYISALMASMNVSLSSGANRIVNEKIESGEFQGATEVVEGALRALLRNGTTCVVKLLRLRGHGNQDKSAVALRFESATRETFQELLRMPQRILHSSRDINRIFL
jgi:Arc/MetJ-type ribon-helix-helix transcriptional regulator